MSQLVLKYTVKLGALSPQGLLIIQAVQSTMNHIAPNRPTVVTSCNDSRHSLKSRHWRGDAVDFRTKHLTEPQKADLVAALRDNLTNDFDLALEGRNTDNEHLHVEYDPKGGS